MLYTNISRTIKFQKNSSLWGESVNNKPITLGDNLIPNEWNKVMINFCEGWETKGMGNVYEQIEWKL